MQVCSTDYLNFNFPEWLFVQGLYYARTILYKDILYKDYFIQGLFHTIVQGLFYSYYIDGVP